MSLLEQQNLRTFQVFLFQNDFFEALGLGLRVYLEHERFIIFVRIRYRYSLVDLLVLILLVKLLSSVVYSRLIIVLRRSAGINLVCFLAFLFLVVVLVLVFLLLLILAIGSFLIFVLASVLVLICQHGVDRCIFLVIRQILELAAVEVVLDEEQAAVLDFLGSLDSGRLGLAILLDFGLGL